MIFRAVTHVKIHLPIVGEIVADVSALTTVVRTTVMNDFAKK
jgi:hypothetical protein